MTVAQLGIYTPARVVTACGVCGSGRLETVLSLGSSPPPCVMHPVGRRSPVEQYYPLEMLRCEDCSLLQLSVIVDPDVVFSPEFPYSSGNSMQLHRTFEGMATAVKAFTEGLAPDDLVVDIGANDGTLLRKFAGQRTVGVEPTDQAERIDGPSYQLFFDEGVAETIREKHGPAKVITACNVMAHVDDVDTVMRGVFHLLADDGVFVADNHNAAAVINGQWDMVYHEHLRFYSPQTFADLLGRYGMRSAYWHDTNTHGGSFRMFAIKGGPGEVKAPPVGDWRGCGDRVRATRAKIRAEVAKGPIWAIGATARGTTILNYCGLDVEDVECVLEVPKSDKLGHYIPGTRIPVVDEQALFTANAPRALLLSWHMADIIVPKLRAKGYDKPILVPLPEPHYV
jgi:2-polyprenyl-3-methyl-5-hydroxy-6-metoxy-1,4-benzoquinol methylase